MAALRGDISFRSTQHTTLWSCTHIPNIIDLSGKTKKLWPGQASLRRSRRSGRSGSGRKNQTKTICLVQMAALRGDISFRHLKQFFLV
jgi:hypothetical protein